jgi:SAM-dependent methyltransferase
LPDEPYTERFFKRKRNGATQSAEVVIPLLLQLVPARSVIDIGCGDGSWLAVFRKHGVPKVLGVDGEYVGRDLLQIPADCFQAADLTKPFEFSTEFDLAISLEVAEHLPAEYAGVFVGCLTKLAPVVLFSAAIPFQGGENHVNEQWPDGWVDLFEKHGYVALDCIRRLVWANEAVEWWYAQNTLLFARASLVETSAALKAAYEQTSPNQLCIVHPKLYCQAIAWREQHTIGPGVKAASRHLLLCLRDAVRRRLHPT